MFAFHKVWVAFDSFWVIQKDKENTHTSFGTCEGHTERGIVSMREVIRNTKNGIFVKRKEESLSSEASNCEIKLIKSHFPLQESC